jgi:hypothetical protein
MCFGSLLGGGGGAGKMAKQQRADEVARQQRIREGMSNIDQQFSTFDDPFYASRAKAYVDYATPTVDRQADEARQALIYALSRNGNLDSSAAIRKNAELGRNTNEARIGIANQGLDIANRARADVEAARSGVVSQLNATGDSSAASAAALRQAQALTQPQGFSPLGQLFANFMASVSQIGSNSGNGYGGFFGPRSPAYAGAGGDSQRIVR